MARCQGIKRDGGRCTASVPEGDTWCWNHHPAHEAARKRNASKAGKSRASREMANIKSLLSDLTERVLQGELPTSVVAVANQVANTRLRALELERKIKETEELEERIERLEAKIQAKPKVMKGVGRWQQR
jgi:hypothetical protein